MASLSSVRLFRSRSLQTFRKDQAFAGCSDYSDRRVVELLPGRRSSADGDHISNNVHPRP